MPIIVTSSQIATPVVPTSVLLLGFCGSDLATEAFDESGQDHILTFVNNAKLITQFPLYDSSSLILDGTGDYIDIPDSSDFTIGSNDYTIESSFEILGGLNSIQALLSKRKTGTQHGWQFGVTDTNFISFIGWANNVVVINIIANVVLVARRKYDVAVTREAGVWRLFLDGVIVASDTETTPILATGGANPLSIGRDVSTAGREFNGRIDEIRIIDGEALYTANYTPSLPHLRDTYDEQILALSPVAYYKMDELAGSTLVDSSGNSRDGTHSNNTLGTAAIVNDGGTSVTYNGGSTSYSDMDPGVLDLATPTSPKTIECWFNTSDDLGPLITGRGPGGTPVIGIYLGNDGVSTSAGELFVIVRSDGGTLYRSGAIGGSVADGLDHHVVWTMGAGKEFKVYLDSVLIHSSTHTMTTGITTSDPEIARDSQTAGNSPHFAFAGAIDNVAIYDTELTETEVVNHYCTGYLPPVVVDNFESAIVLQLSMDGANGGTTFIDDSGNGHVMTATVSTTSTALFKFGTASQKVTAGNSVHINSPTPTITNGSTPFTMEAWVYIVGLSYFGSSRTTGLHVIVGEERNGTNGNQIFYVADSGALGMFRGLSVNGLGANVAVGSDAGVVPNNQWVHCAVQYDPNHERMYLLADGIKVGDGPWPNGGWLTQSQPMRIGSSDLPSFPQWRLNMNGYIDDLRITEAFRYNENFTPPIVPNRPDIVESGLLLHLNPANPACFGAAETSATNLISSGAVTGAGLSDAVGTGPHTPDPNNFPEYNSINGGIFDFAGGRGMNVDEDLGTHTEFTLDMWYYKASTANEYLVDGRNDGATWLLTNYNLPPSYNLVHGGNAAYNFDGTFDPSNADFINRWQHLVLTSDATGSKMYIDGTLRTLLVSNSTNENLGVNYRIGHRYTKIFAIPWTGYMGPIKIYDRVLSESEALQNFNADKGRFT